MKDRTEACENEGESRGLKVGLGESLATKQAQHNNENGRKHQTCKCVCEHIGTGLINLWLNIDS